MRSNIIKTFLLLIVTLVVVSCNKDIDLDQQFQPLKPAKLDESAGTWTSIFVTNNQVVLAAATNPVGSDAYNAELAAIKAVQANLNPDQHKAIEYWSGGGIMRWNQIFRDLVARYNHPPEPAADGTYPAPDAENPFSMPLYPFSNPPYAARAFSYVSAAQYDALISAWYYKYKFNRPAPYQVDNTIQSLMPASELPGYPNEEAVMSGAAAEMLKNLFPAAVEEITKKAAEQRNAALWSGKATPSEITSSLALGKSVAAEYIKRAGNDNMKTAGGNKALWDGLSTNATNRGDVAWQSLETPARPPMLPVFNKVLPWKMTYDTIKRMRPGPPPVVGAPLVVGETNMTVETAEVKWYSDNLTRERLAIVHKWADGSATYTPIGHWNDIATDHIADANFSEVRAARAYALLNITEHNAGVACWDTKFFYFNARPSQLDHSIKTGTGVPNFPSYVSGHSTFSQSAAQVLSYLFPQSTDEFNAMALEAAMSRLYGGIHYRTDCMAGLDLGKDVGNYTVSYVAMTDGAGD